MRPTLLLLKPVTVTRRTMDPGASWKHFNLWLSLVNISIRVLPLAFENEMKYKLTISEILVIDFISTCPPGVNIVN